MGYGYYNGIFENTENIKLPLSDRAFFFGDAVYDVAIGSGGRIYQLNEHLVRITENAKHLGMPCIPELEELASIAFATVKKSGLISYIVYLQLSRDLNFRVHSAEKCKKTNILVTVEPFDLYEASECVRLILREDRRYSYCNIKTVNLLPAVIASTDAESKEYDECIFVRNGIITECAHSNISIIKDGILITHPADRHILPGITRKNLINKARCLGLSVEEKRYGINELYSADEIIITSTTRFMRRAYEIEGIQAGGKNLQLFSHLRNALLEDFSYFIRQ